MGLIPSNLLPPHSDIYQYPHLLTIFTLTLSVQVFTLLISIIAVNSLFTGTFGTAKWMPDKLE